MGMAGTGGRGCGLSRPARLSVIGDTIRSCAHILAVDPGQFAAQLLLRMETTVDDPAGYRGLLDAAAAWHGRAWLRPVRASLRSSRDLLRTLPTGDGSGECAAVSADGQLAIAPMANDTLGVWNLGTGQLLRRLVGHTDLVRAVALTPDGARATTASEDRTLRVWDVRTGALVRTLALPSMSALALALAPDGRRAVAACERHPIVLLNMAACRRTAVLAGHSRLVRAIAVTPNGHRAVSIGWDDTARLWDLAAGLELRALDWDGLDSETIAVSPDGRSGAFGTNGGAIGFWDLESGTVTTTQPGHTSLIRGLAFAAGRRLVSTGRDRAVLVWDTRTGEVSMRMTGHTDEVGALCVIPDGHRVITADRELKMWSLDSGKLLATLGRHDNSVEAIAVTRDGRRAVSTDGGEVKYWDLASGAAPVEPVRGCGSGPPDLGCRTRRCRDGPRRKLGRCRKRVWHPPLRPACLARNRKHTAGMTLQVSSTKRWPERIID
jgi:WD40 repeat protein